MKEKLKKTWQTLIKSYKATVEYTDHGATGDPRATIAEALSEGASVEDLRQALGVIAHIKEHDGRFGRSNRQWLYGSIDFESADWYLEYGRFMGGVDDIHTTHRDNLTSCLRQFEREFTEIDAVQYGKELLDKDAETVVAEKQGMALARVATEPEMITVWTKDGNCEGTETAMPGQVIMTRANDDGTPYVDEYGHTNTWCYSRETFEKKYDTKHPDPETGVYKPAGGPQRFVKLPKPVWFKAPWGKVQIIRNGYLNVTDPHDTYGIALDEFQETYRIIG